MTHEVFIHDQYFIDSLDDLETDPSGPTYNDTTAQLYLADLWRDLAGMPSAFREEARDPDSLRRHVAMPEAEAILAESFLDFVSSGMSHFPLVVRARVRDVFDCFDFAADPTRKAEVLMGTLAWIWRVLSVKSHQALLDALTARRVQGMWRYGDAWKTDYTAQGLIDWAKGRLGRYLETGDVEQILDCLNGLMMAWTRGRE